MNSNNREWEKQTSAKDSYFGRNLKTAPSAYSRVAADAHVLVRVSCYVSLGLQKAPIGPG